MLRLTRKHRALVLPIAHPEQQEAGEPSRGGGACLTHDLGEGEPLEPRSPIDLLSVLDRARDDDRRDRAGGELGPRQGPCPDRVLGKASSGERRFPHGAMVRVPSHLMRSGIAVRFAVGLVSLVLVVALALVAAPAPGSHADGAVNVMADAAAAATEVAPSYAASVAAPPVDQGPDPRSAPASASIDMKHVWQSLNNCGPASVVMALSSLGIDVSQEDARIPLRGANVLSGMGPQKVDPWISANFGLRAVWRNNGTNDLLRRLVANGFTPMVTQWMQDPSISRIAHWRVVRGYDDALATFYVNDPMLGRMVPLSYQWFQNEWQPFSYRYLVVYDPKDELLLRRIVGEDWNDLRMRANFYERTKAEALAQNTQNAWIAFGEAAYGYGAFAEAVAAFEKGIAFGSVQGVFTMRSSYPQALRALGRQQDAAVAAQRLSTTTVSPTVAAPPDGFALYLAFARGLPFQGAHLAE